LVSLAASANAAGIGRSAQETTLQRALRDAERTNREHLSEQKEAAERAARANAEALRLAQARVAAVTELRQIEAAIGAIAERIDELAQQQREAEQQVEVRAKAMQPLLPLIERLSLYPAETLLTVPAPPDQAVRGVLVLQALARQIEAEAEALNRGQAALDAATEELKREAPRLQNAAAAQKLQADRLDQEIDAAHRAQADAEGQASEATIQAAAAASRMDSLRSALAAIESQTRSDEAKAREQGLRSKRQKHPAEAEEAPGREFVASRPGGATSTGPGGGPRGQFQPPVIGVVVNGWGDRTDGGPATGLSYLAPPDAHVISPCGGRVVFADKFRSYGLLLIIDCGAGYHFVLAGFQRLQVKLGQSLLAGEPVGVMPEWAPGMTGPRPSLYLELRHDGSPVNPAPWLRSSN
jgi:murein hydrolase activator